MTVLEYHDAASGPVAADAPRTFLPQQDRDPAPAEQARIRPGASANAKLAVAGAAAAGLSMGLLLTAGIGLIPPGWTLIVSYLWFVLIYSTLVFMREQFSAVRDRFVTVLMVSAGVTVLGTLALVIGFVFTRGQEPLAYWNFFSQDMTGVGPLSGLDQGGILHALVGTLQQIGIALAITLPLGLTTAIYLNEVGGRFAKVVRTVVEAMTALPSVVAGLFIYASVVMVITHQTNGFAAALAITVLMLPIMIRSADVVLRLVPGNLREAGLALGAGQWAVVWHVVLPTVRSGLATAVILATAHGIGETAPVLLTSGFTGVMNFNPFYGPQTPLPLAALELVRSPVPQMVARGFATAAFLLFVVLVLFILARWVGGQEAGKATDAQLRRMAARSRRDLPRIEKNYHDFNYQQEKE
ncbi:ABC transporter permease subunit [Arthrobacter sp. I2-34]|uniref:ABC transporter permease subunit n=1 Tax=Arthrobacter hankyongi TaxID=2904801 RepID=A0ABS9L151_9MICC|nr:ABC transporter permease subunit [Arthrobacter hankyongi]MCG2620353.1 ABC transporter permease subunit [Arthrobacter hankyongi]